MMMNIKAAGLLAATMIFALFLGGCSNKVLDYRNATIENGKIFSGDNNEPFSGRLTNLPELDLLQSQEGFKQFLRPVVRSNATLNHYGDYPGATAMLALSQGFCDVQVADGYLEGSASCAGPGDQGKGSEMEFEGGALTGKFKYYNPAYSKALISEATFEDGVPVGEQKVYGLDTGKLLMTVVWNSGGLNGQVEKFDAETGRRVFMANYVDGKLDGPAKKLSPSSGNVVDTMTYKAGRLDGPEDQYDDSGAHLVHETWVDGYRHGRVTKWDQSGTLVSEVMYQYGQKVDLPPAPGDAASSGGEASESATSRAGVDADKCQNDWVSAYRSQAGSDAPVTADQLSEWNAWCSEGKVPPALQ
jgi:antitoxin component YwqK of YwqJK toxin-antitoxin module